MKTKADWNKRYMDLAHHIGEWSKEEVGVGCIIVNAENNRIISTGFNGRPEFLDGLHLPHKCGITHAEVNALVGLSSVLTMPVEQECKVYVTKPPCRECAEFLHSNINIQELITVPAKLDSSWLQSQCQAQEFFEAHDVTYTVYDISKELP